MNYFYKSRRRSCGSKDEEDVEVKTKKLWKSRGCCDGKVTVVFSRKEMWVKKKAVFMKHLWK